MRCSSLSVCMCVFLVCLCFLVPHRLVLSRLSVMSACGLWGFVVCFFFEQLRLDSLPHEKIPNPACDNTDCHSDPSPYRPITETTNDGKLQVVAGTAQEACGAIQP